MIVTAAICTFERHGILGDAIESLRRQSLPHDQFQILVVDNSTVCTKRQQFAATLSDAPNVRYLHVDQPNLSHARNIAVNESTTPYLAFLDDDEIAAHDWLEKIVRFFDDADKDVAAVGGPVTPIWEAPRPNWLHDELLGYLGLLDRGDQVLEIGRHEWLIGGNIAYRREALVAVGGFRVDLGRHGAVLMGNDELELQARLGEAGYRSFYCPGVCVSHRVPAERLTQAWMRKRIFWQAVSDLMATPGAPLGPRRSMFGLGLRETSNPKAFEKQCRRILKTVKRLGVGDKTL